MELTKKNSGDIIFLVKKIFFLKKISKNVSHNPGYGSNGAKIALKSYLWVEGQARICQSQAHRCRHRLPDPRARGPVTAAIINI